MSQPITEVPMAVMSQNQGYPTIESMTTNTVNNPQETTDQETQNEPPSSLLRLRGGGCITDCLAAIGCCVVCEDCCC